MLKVEKIARSAEISIALRKKESLFSPTFLKALFWAIAFHASAVIFFHVAPFTLDSGRVYPPASVESDLFDGGAIATIEQQGPPKRYLLAPKESRPEIHSYPSFTMMQYLENIQESGPEVDPFVRLEQSLWTEKLFKPQEKSLFKPIEIQTSGSLAERSFKFKEEIPRVVEPFKAIYSVQVENKTGHIFWYEPKILSHGKKPLVEAVLRSIQFEPDLKGFITSGDIEITFNQRRRYD